MQTVQTNTVDIPACIAGDGRSWHELVTRHSAVVYSAVRNVIQSRSRRCDQEDIKDVTQNVFVRLVKRDFHLLRNYDPKRCSLPTYLTIVARSTALDFLRYGFMNTVPLDDFSDDVRVEPEEPETGADIPSGVLTERQVTVMRLLFDKDMDVASVATALGITAQTVRSIKHQALKRLRDHYGEAAAV